MFLDFLSHILDNVASPERLNTAMIALVFVSIFGALFGSFSGNANPFLWVMLDRVFGGLAKKTYKVGRSVSSLHFRGTIILILYIVFTGLFAAAVILLDKEIPLEGFMTPVLLTCVLSGGATWSALIKLHRAIRAEDKKSKSNQHLPKGSYYDIAVSTRTNLNTTDTHGIIRGGIGFVSFSLDKGIIAPLFWFIIAGLPAAFIYSGIAAARWSLSKEGFAKGIGNLAMVLEAILGFIPQIITTIILAFAALMTPSARLTRTVIGIFSRGTGRANYGEGGLPLTALAWGLGVSLGGPVEDRDGSVLKRAWIGSPKSTAKVEIHHLRISIYLSVMSYILTFAFLLAGIMAWRFAEILI
jgi:adenosylcobinamide-phosphate synthase